MNVLLDECLDRPLAKRLLRHDVQTVRQIGWSAFTDGHLLTLAADQFDAFITFDRNLPFQQNLAKYPIAVLVLRAPTNNIIDLAPLVPKILASLPVAPKGQATLIDP